MRAKIFNIPASLLRLCAAVVFTSSLLVSAAFADRSITKIDVVNKPDRAVISVQGSGTLSMMPFSSKKGRYIGFQFPCSLQPRSRIVGILSGRIYNVRYTTFRRNPPTTRVVVNTAAHLNYSTEWSADKKHVDITIWKHGYNPSTSPAVQDSVQQPKVKVRGLVQEIQAQADSSSVEKAANAAQSASVNLLKADAVSKPAVITQKYTAAAQVKPAVYKPAAVEDDKKVSLNFLGADINDVLKAMAVQSGKNIVASKDVTGNITVSLTDVSVEDALDYVAKLSGYSYVDNNGTYLVAPKASIAGLDNAPVDNENTIEIVAIHYTNPDDILSILKAMFPNLRTNKSQVSENVYEQTSSSSSDDKSKNENSDNKNTDKKDKSSDKNKVQIVNLIVLGGPVSEVMQAKQAIVDIDDSVKYHAGLLKTEIYKVKFVDPAQLAETISKLVPGVVVGPAPSEGFNYTISKDSLTDDSSSSKSTNDDSDLQTKVRALVINGSEDDVNRALDVAKSFDIKSPQIKIEAKITSITDEGEKELGLEWSWDKISFTEVSTDAWHRSTVGFAAKLDAIISKGNGEVLAAPNLLCLEGKEAEFFVGDKVTYVKSQTTDDNGKIQIETDEKKAGITLRVIGSASQDGFITMKLHPEVSTLTLTSNDAGYTLPTVSTKQIDQTVRVKNGETIVVGGLINSSDIRNMSKVPLLGDLPFLGKLFRHVDNTKNRTEVVMFITASVIDD